MRTSLKLLLLSLLSLGIHLFPFFSSLHPLGYDTGFYRRYLIQPFISFPNPPVPGLGSDALIPRLILDSLRWMGIPTDYLLYGSLILFFILIPFLVYTLLSKTINKKTALIGAVLITFSSVQYYAYWFMLWKNMWAICLLLTIFILFNRKLFIPIIALDILLALSHQTTTIIYIATLCIMLFTENKRWKEVITHLSITSLIFLLVSTHTHEIIKNVSPVGVFLTMREYITLTLPCLILGGYAVYNYYKEKKFPPFLAFIIATCLFPLFHLPFYQRIFVFTDIGIIMLAARGAELLLSHVSFRNINRKSVISFFALLICVGLLIGNIWGQIRGLQPLMSQEDIAQIEQLKAVIPPGATVLTTADEAPWFEGWTLFHIAAPGMLQDKHDLEKWTAFWNSTSTPEKILFLNDFTPPLYISSVGDIQGLIGTLPPCLKKISSIVLYDECKI